MDRQLADTYLKQWAAWVIEDQNKSPYAIASWQKHVESGYQEESPRAGVSPGPDSLMLVVDGAVTRVSNQYPAMGVVLKKVYLGYRYAPHDMVETALLRFVSAWYEVAPEVA